MRWKEILNDSYDVTKARIDHLEDSAFAGQQAIRRAMAVLLAAAKTPQIISIKPDGKPAILWGRDSQGFALGDKYMRAAGLPHNIDQMIQVLSNRRNGPNTDLVLLYQKIWKTFEASLQPDFTGFLFGDLMYTSQPEIQAGAYVFQPNTVQYRVDVKSELGKKISQSQMGIVVHSYFPEASGTGRRVTPADLQKANQLTTDGLLIMSDSLTSTPELTAPQQLSSLQQLLTRHGADIDHMLTSTSLATAKVKSLPDTFKKFINQHVIHQQNLNDLPAQFQAWLSKQDTSGRMQEYLSRHAQALAACLQAFVLLMQAKNHMISELDPAAGDLSASVNGQPGQEGFIIHTNIGPYKLVNRFGFSAANMRKA